MGKKQYNLDNASLRAGGINAAQAAEAREAAFVRNHDAKQVGNGFELREMMGLHGEQLEEALLYPPGKRPQRKMPHEVRRFTNDDDLIADAIAQNPYNSVYNHWRMYAPEWLRTLHAYICDSLRSRAQMKDVMELAPDIIEHMVKPVVALQTSLDLHKGVDCMFIFHDPIELEAMREGGFKDQSESTYWDPQNDTVVTMDIAADIPFKLASLEEKGIALRADVLASKLGSMANPGLQPLSGDQGKHWSHKEYDARLRHLAGLIVNLYFAKKNNSLPHLRDPEKEAEDRVAAERRNVAEKAKAAAGKKETKDEKRRQASVEAKAARDARAQANKSLKNPPKKKG